jgi:TPR repeat protein
MSFSMSIGDELMKAIELVHTDRPAGLEEVKRLALAGDKSAILSLGLYLSEDSATNEEAVPWLVSAAGFGSEDAAWNLAMIAREKGDEKGMREWIDVAAGLGEVDAVKARSLGYDVAAVLQAYR